MFLLNEIKQLNNLKLKSENNYFSYILLPYLLLVIVHILLSLPMKVPIIWPDEFAYLFFGKYIAGYQHIQQIPRIELTGSFGYSVLLAPIFMLFNNPQKIYSSILILNGIIGSTLYIGLFLLLKNTFNADNNRAFWISLIVCLYPAYLLQTDVALTDAITPAFFVFGVVLFNQFIRHKSLGYGLLFALFAGYLNWIHIRMLPFTIISIFFLVSLVYYKRMPIFQAGLSIVMMIIMILMGVIIGDHLTYVISGALEKSQQLTISLIQVAEVLLIFILLGSSLYFMLRKYYLYMLFIILGLISGVLASTSFTALWFIPVSGLIFLFILLIAKRIKFTYAVWAYVVLIVIAFFTYFVLPDFGYYTVVTERIMIWFINASGSLFYTLFSTYCLFLIGVVFMVQYIWKNGLIQVPAVSHTDMFKEEKKNRFSFWKLLNDESSLTILFLMSTAFLMIFITIFPSKLAVTHYRADHLFYGRYVEVVLAGFMAVAIYKLITSDATEFIISVASSWTVFIILSFVMIITYDNVIPSELSFRSVLSFFPLRALLGNINIMLYFLASIIVSLFVAFSLRYNPKFGKIILAAAFLSFTTFTYIYVDYYHQVEKYQRNKLVGFIKEYFPQIDTLSYDKTIFTETSQNGLSYVWLMPEKHFSFFKSSSNKAKQDLVIAGNTYGYAFGNDAVLINIEHDGNDHLWLSAGKLQDSLRSELMPSFFDLPLNKNYVGGVLRTGFHNDKWINGKAEIVTYINEPDSVYTLEIELASSSVKPQNLIIWLENKELFNRDIDKGGWRYTLNLKSDSVLKKLHFKLFSDLTRDKSNNNRLKGIVVNSFIIRKVENKNKEIPVAKTIVSNTSNFDDIEYSIYPRRNIDISQLNLNPGDTLILPFVIKNTGKNPIIFDEEYPLYLSYTWKDFVFKSEFRTEILDKPLKGFILPGKEMEIFVKLTAPDKKEKFFLSFSLLSNNRVIIKQKEKREYLLNLKSHI